MYGLVRRSCILCGPDQCPCILLAPELCAGILHGPDLRPRILCGPDPSVPLHVPDRCSGIFLNLCLVVLYDLRGLYGLHGLYGYDRCPCILLGGPGLELLQHVFSRWLTVFGLDPIGRFYRGSNFLARRGVRCSRRQSLSG